MTPDSPPPPPSHPSSEGSPFLTVDEDGIATLLFDDPDRSVNLLAAPVMRRLASRIEEIAEGAHSGRIRGLLIRSGKDSGFIAGADIGEISEIGDAAGGEEASRYGQAVYLDLERLPVPTVAAIRGVALGGGLELALAARHRVVDDDPRTRLGLPEVQLGILPAWGGTTRLPRLIGLSSALDLLLTGKRITGRKAKELGIVDAVLPAATFEESSLTFLRDRIEGPPLRRPRRSFGSRLLDESIPGRRLVLAKAGSEVRRKTGGHYPAPLRILEVVAGSQGRSLERALALEAAAAGELIASRIARNLMRVFRLQEGAKKWRGAGGKEAAAAAREVERIGVIGAGVMGGGIAHLFADAGIQVRIRDLRHEAVTGALRHARTLFQKSVERGRRSARDARERMDRISGGVSWDGFGNAEVVVEAVVERMAVKKEVLGEAERETGEETILASNTSTLSIDAMAEGLERPGNFLGMHFFNPVDRMPLVEIVRGRRSSERAVALLHALSVRTGKVPVVVADGPGFLVNRILGPYLNEAGFLLGEGANPLVIDRIVTGWGMPMGPFRLLDEVGIDVARHAGDTLHAAFGERLAPARPLVTLEATGRTGRKGGLGFYRYENGEEKGLDAGILALLGVPERESEPEPEKVIDRLLLSMVQEAARALTDGIVATAADVDLAMIMGTGFPPFRGGLLRWADDEGLDRILGRMETLSARHGVRFSPPALLTELVAAGETFQERFPG